MPRVAFEDLDRPHIDLDQPVLPGTEHLVPAEWQWVRLDDEVKLDGSEAVTGWHFRGMRGEIFGGPDSYDIVPHYANYWEVGVDIVGAPTPKFSTQEDILRNLIKVALSFYDAAQ